jgi:hypothetical protein
MNKGTLVSRVATRLTLTSDDPLYSNLGDIVNEAIHYLDTASPDGWQWMRGTINTTISAQSYTFSQLSTTTTIAKILSVKVQTYQTWQPLRLRNQDELDQIYPRDTPGLPESFTVEANTLSVYPPPSGNYAAKIRVVYSESDLVSDGDSPMIPASFHTGIIDAALMIAYQALADNPRVAIQEQRVIATIQRMRTYGIQYDPSPTIRVRDWL